MKTIAVLTDFSTRAESAARYALGLASHLQANVLLYNSFLLPSSEPLGLQVAWSMESYDEIQGDAEKELHALAEKLRSELTINSIDSSSFKPTIYCKCDHGTLSHSLELLLSDGEIILVVMGTHKKGISGFMMSNHLHEVIDNVARPVLIVPENAVFKSISKIAFATDMKGTDLEVVNSLAGLARPFNAEVMLAHISAKASEEECAKMVTHFLEEVANVINYQKIYYRSVKENQVQVGLNWLAENVAFEMLVMVHRHKGFWGQFFNGSYTQKMAAQLNIPLMVYPCPANSLPVF